MLAPLLNAPRHWAARALARTPPPPLGLTLSLLWRCNCRCATCRVHQRESRELSVDEYARIFRSLGGGLLWATLTGGEPCLREDLPLIVEALAREAHPYVITLATNGTLTDRLLHQAEEILRRYEGTLVVNLSRDAVGADQDELRGLPGAWDRALASFRALERLRQQHDNLVLGIHTVISRHNVDALPHTWDVLLALDADSYVAEVAQPREELCTTELDLAPMAASYQRAVASLQRRLAARRARGAARLIRALRHHYYRYAGEQLSASREIYPCYAALLSAHLAPDGKLWDCAVKARELGDLSADDFDFRRTWASAQAQGVRQEIRRERCRCTLANACYWNMLMSPTALTRIGWTLVRGRWLGAPER